MSITKFEEGKKYRFLKDSTGNAYCGCTVSAGEEFTVYSVSPSGVSTKDINYNGLEGEWVVWFEGCDGTTFDDFEEVIEVSDEGVDFGRYVCEDDLQYKIEQSIETNDRLFELVPSDVNIEEEDISYDLIKEVIALQQEHNLTLMFDCDEVVVHIGDNDTEYQISSQEQLTTLIEASKVMKRFERKVNYND
jgi:hypothetical protein